MDRKIAFFLSAAITLLIAANFFLLSSFKTSPQLLVIARVIDGDTFELSDGTTIRLKNINTPEKGEKGYAQAKQFLKEFENTSVQLEAEGLDKYGRTLAKVYTSDYINLELVKNGLATKFMLDSEISEFISAEKNAIENQLGLWKQSPHHSCFNLDMDKYKISIKNSCNLTNIKNWTLREEGRKRYKFPECYAGEINLYLSNGENNKTDLFWESPPSLKNTFYLLDENDLLVQYEINY
jgi:endonuclease YncB( thermonuclease family)